MTTSQVGRNISRRWLQIYALQNTSEEVNASCPGAVVYSGFLLCCCSLSLVCVLPSKQSGTCWPRFAPALIPVGVLLCSSVVGSVSAVCFCKLLERLMFRYEACLLYIYFCGVLTVMTKYYKFHFWTWGGACVGLWRGTILQADYLHTCMLLSTECKAIQKSS